MFSVIIPLYNKEHYLATCLKSVLAQTFSEFEVIVVNDGSIDNGISVLRQFDDHRIKVVHQPNSGVSATRNNGVKHARFDHVAFLDADDWWHENFLREMKDLITSFPMAGIYGSSYYIVKNEKSIPARIGVLDNFRMGYIDYFNVYNRTFWVPINCSFVVVRKCVFEGVGGFKPGLKLGEDFDLWVRIALGNKVGYINKCLAYSNQDVELSQRAIGGDRLYQPVSHFIFNLSYLKPFEEESKILKQLLDGLRVRSLLPYYLAHQYASEVTGILKEVDFKQQPFFYKAVYHTPVGLVRVYFSLKKLGSIVKQEILRFIR